VNSPVMADFVSLTDIRHTVCFKLKTLSRKAAQMTKRTNPRRLHKPDRRAYLRPEVGLKKFIAYKIEHVSTSAMER